MIKHLHFIRHAEIASHYRGRYVGSLDLSLSPEGKAQASSLGEMLPPQLKQQTPVWCSPMKRCLETWAAINEKQADIHADLREVDFGEWEGKSFAEINSSHPQLVGDWAKFDSSFAFPNGEKLSDFHNRMNAIKLKILDYHEESLVIVAHGGVITHLLCLFLGLNPSQHLIFHLERPSLTSLRLHENGLGVLTGLNQNIRSLS